MSYGLNLGWGGTYRGVYGFLGGTCSRDILQNVVQGSSKVSSNPQIHLAKPGARRKSEDATAASKLRAVGILSTWWRVYVSATLQTKSAQNWLSGVLPRDQAGGRRGRDAAVTFTILAESDSIGHYVANLDLAKAFDHVRPDRALSTLDWHGFPNRIAALVQQVWGSRERVLTWQGKVARLVSFVRSSIPQGDALAMSS